MNSAEREAWYRYQHEKYGIPVEHLRREFEEELSGKNPMDAPLEIPDKMEVVFKYSYGGQSRFFRELRENKALYGAECPECGKTYCPPRSHCHTCYQPTQWKKLAGTGTVEACTVQHYTTSSFIKKAPFVCAYVKLDGTDSLLMTNMEVDDVAKVKVGTKVKAVYRELRLGAITDVYFKPLD